MTFGKQTKGGQGKEDYVSRQIFFTDFLLLPHTCELPLSWLPEELEDPDWARFGSAICSMQFGGQAY